MKPSLRSTGRRLKKLIYPYLPATLKGEYESYRFAQRTRVPNTVYLETTSACNLNCVMCAAQRHATKAIKPSGYMDLILFKRLVDEIARDLPSIEYVYLHKDGEPLLHPDIVEMIQYRVIPPSERDARDQCDAARRADGARDTRHATPEDQVFG